MSAATLFPYLGLTAYCLLWLHAVVGPFEPWLRRRVNFDIFVRITADIIFVCIILHPLLLLVSLNFNIGNLFYYYGVKFVLLGIIGWVLLLTYDVAKFFKMKGGKYWHSILIISNIGFVLTFFHGLYLGSDFQQGPLRTIWIIAGIAGIVALIYTYVIMPAIKKAPQ